MKASKTTVTIGNVKLPIYRTPVRGIDRFTLCWMEAGKRIRKTFDSEMAARRHALDIGVKLANGDREALKLTAADHESFIIARRDLAPLEIPLHVAVAEYLAARKALPDGVTLKGAADEYARRHKTAVKAVSVESAVVEFLLVKERKGVRTRTLGDLRAHLEQFKARFRTSIQSVSSADIEKWLDGQRGGGRYRRNLRSSAITLFRWCQKRGYLPRDVKTEAELTSRPESEKTKPGILTPEEMAKLVTVEDEQARLYFVLAGFAGIRSAELLRLTWDDIHFETGVIVVPSAGAKTGNERPIPIADNLGRWLATFKQRKGRLCGCAKAETVALRYGRPVLGRKWPANGLRHSFGSYRLAQTQSRDKTSLEMGNSVQMLKANYENIRTHDGRIVTPSLATAWFAIEPEMPANVIGMKAPVSSVK